MTPSAARVPGVHPGAFHVAPPAGPAGAIANRVLVQTSMSQVRGVTAMVDQKRSGLVLARGGHGESSTRDYISALRVEGFGAPVLYDSEAYRQHRATVAKPFQAVGPPSLLSANLDGALDEQRLMGVDLALTPTGRIDAGDTDTLKAATAAVAELRRNDVLFVVPIDSSMISDAFIDQVEAILQHAGHPVAIILTGQFDPLENHTRAAIRNARRLCRTVRDVCFFRSDLSALDLISHGSLAGSIGTGGSMRHMVPASEQPRFRVPGDSPSVLFGDLGSWQRGETIAKKFGGQTAPRCPCGPCAGRSLSGYLGRDDHDAARAHSVIIWQRWLKAILAQPTLLKRAEYWKAKCKAAVDYHTVLAQQLHHPEPFQVQPSLTAWASMDVWDTKVPR